MLTATAVAADEILLEWNMPDDNGSNFTSYQIQRWDPTDGADEDGAWSDAIDITAPAGDPQPPPPTVYTDRGAVDTPLAAGTTYSYRIRANGGTPATCYHSVTLAPSPTPRPLPPPPQVLLARRP